MLMSLLVEADAGIDLDPRNRTGSRLTRRSQVKARLYRTALTVSIVAILLEGLGAGWKWG
jgi:hypothetical protein